MSAEPSEFRVVACPACGAKHRLRADPAGRTLKCLKCAHEWVEIAVPDDMTYGSIRVDADATGRTLVGGPPKLDEPTGVDPMIGGELAEFKIKRLLGKGGMGAVYEGVDTLLQRSAAVKVLPRSAAGDTRALVDLLREARAASLVRHPNLVAIYQVGEYSGGIFIAMELVTGGSCLDWLKKKGPMSEAQATWLIAEAARGLAAAHRHKIVHRDIKPANLMLDGEGSVKVADFGLAMKVKGAATISGGHVMGTPRFMSPEQAKGEPLDARSDVYSLGATYFCLLTGRAPFPGPSLMDILYAHVEEPVPDPATFRPGLPAGCRRVIEKAMAKKREDRYQSGDEMAADLGRIG
jgi:urea transport system substrate-binding protein